VYDAVRRRQTRGGGTSGSTASEFRKKDSSQTGLWHLVAWRFISAEDPPPSSASDEPSAVDDAAAAAAAANAATAAAYLPVVVGPRVLSEMDSVCYECVEPALDSFATLYCPRCHVYDCNLHGCGQDQPQKKWLEPGPAAVVGVRKEGNAEKEARAARETAAAAAAAAAAAVMAAERHTVVVADVMGSDGNIAADRGGTGGGSSQGAVPPMPPTVVERTRLGPGEGGEASGSVRGASTEVSGSRPCGPGCWRLHCLAVAMEGTVGGSSMGKQSGVDVSGAIGTGLFFDAAAIKAAVTPKTLYPKTLKP